MTFYLVSEHKLMFSLWICPDCALVGRRVAVRPANATPEGGAPAHPPRKSSGQNPAAALTLAHPTPVAVSEWTCPQCGQVGELVEVRGAPTMQERRYHVEHEPDDREAQRLFMMTALLIFAGWAYLTALFMG